MKQKVKKVVLFLGGILVITFITVYIMSISGYYEQVENKSTALTEDAINKFEKDILSGKDIVASNYLSEKETYDNLFSRTGIKIGNVIESMFKVTMRFIMKEINGAIE